MSRQKEGGAVVPDKDIHETLAVGHPLVPVGKPQRAKQFFRYLSKNVRSWVKGKHAKPLASRKQWKKNVPIWLPLLEAWESVSLNTIQNKEFHAKGKEVCLMGDRK